ncbi:helix-turn-helix transcriptional regulator [Plantibacter sp. M259]|uniref:helix-turn-helix domain-containing protein n=1 Tax=Plantibacter sp. M259 TaxID=2583822 RepID=UPI001110B9FE
MDIAFDFNDAVAAELRRQRAARGITIDEVARRAGMVRTTVLRYLNGKRAIPIGALYGLSGALAVEAHRVVAAAEASCAAMSAANGILVVGVTDSMDPELRPGHITRVRSRGRASARDNARVAPVLTARSPADGGAGGGDLPDHRGTGLAPACVAVSGDTRRRLGPHRSAPDAAHNLIA